MLLNRVLESNEAEPAEAARLPIYVCALPTRYARNLVGPREPEWRDHHFFPPHPGLENRELFLAFNAQDAQCRPPELCHFSQSIILLVYDSWLLPTVAAAVFLQRRQCVNFELGCPVPAPIHIHIHRTPSNRTSMHPLQSAG